MKNKRSNSRKEFARQLQKYSVEQEKYLQTLALDEQADPFGAIGAWFLGPKAENEELFKALINAAIDDHVKDRLKTFPGDPLWLTNDRKNSEAYQQSVQHFTSEVGKLLKRLDGSVPFFSYRYQGHMLWDVTLPSVVGYFAAMLYNQNNVAAEASPVTTVLEMHVGDDLCKMLGYYVPERDPDTFSYIEEESDLPVAWGHITCDGTVANMEALWAARNLKYYAIGMRAALIDCEELARARGIAVTLASGETKRLVELTTWELLNIPLDGVLELPGRIHETYDIDEDLIDELLDLYTLQTLGHHEFSRRYMEGLPEPAVLVSGTHHYSWPKAAAMLGMGRQSLLSIAVDLNARLDTADLRRELDDCVLKQRPVAMVVAVLGTTGESAVDPLKEMLSIRDEYRKQGLDFWVHVDAAWGGYFNTMLRKPDTFERYALKGASVIMEKEDDPHCIAFLPEIAMNAYVNEQFAAMGTSDSITVDPHKAGYIPYPAGGLCYRNAAMRDLISFSAPVVHHGGDIDPAIGAFGIEGSKSGAAAAAVYLSHRVIPINQAGYGKILGRCLWNSKRLYAAMLTMRQENDPFKIVMMQRLPTEKAGKDEDEIRKEKKRLYEEVVVQSNRDLIQRVNEDKEFAAWFRSLGSDQVILSFVINFRRDGVWNKDIHKMNAFNQAIFKKLSILKPDARNKVPLFVTESIMDDETHGRPLLIDMKRRLGIVDEHHEELRYQIMTTMNPWLSDTEGEWRSMEERHREAPIVIPKIVDEFRGEILKVWGEHAF